MRLCSFGVSHKIRSWLFRWRSHFDNQLSSDLCRVYML